MPSAKGDCLGVVVDPKGRTVLRLMRKGYWMDPERAKRIKKMLASSAMVERALPALHLNMARDPGTQAKLGRNPGLLGQVFEKLLDRMVPFMEAMDDQAIAEVTKFQESPAAALYGKRLEAMMGELPRIAQEWEAEARKMIESSS